MQEKVFYQVRMTKLWALMFGIMGLVFVLPVVLLFADDDPARQAKAWQFLWKVVSDWQMVLAIVALLLLSIVSMRVQATATLRISVQGMVLDMPLKPVWVARALDIAPFSVRWTDVEDMVLSLDRGRRVPMLHVTLAGGKRVRVNMLMWRADRTAGLELLKLLRQRMKPDRERLESLLADDPLVEAIQQAHGPIRMGDMPAPKGPGMSFDIAKSPPALFVTVLALAAGGLGFMYCLTYGPAYMSTPPWITFVLSGALGALLARAVLESGEMPKLERNTLAVFAGIGIGVMSYGALLRLDAQLSDGYRDVVFELKSGHVLRAADPDIPALASPLDRPFWADQKLGSTWTIPVAHGPLGIWQYDQRPLLAIIRQHYLDKR